MCTGGLCTTAAALIQVHFGCPLHVEQIIWFIFIYNTTQVCNAYYMLTNDFQKTDYYMSLYMSLLALFLRIKLYNVARPNRFSIIQEFNNHLLYYGIIENNRFLNCST